jgi:broad specificity phosphatase PhoE
MHRRIVYLVRHAETAWSLTGQHTGRSDLPLTDRGERDARTLGERLRGLTGSCSATAARAANRRDRSPHGLTAA